MPSLSATQQIRVERERRYRMIPRLVARASSEANSEGNAP